MPVKLISLRKLFHNDFHDHEGRPGKVGGSIPKSGSNPKKRINPIEERDAEINTPEILSQIEIPGTMYHVTSKDNLGSITERGLSKGKDNVIGQGNFGVYLVDEGGLDMIFHDEELMSQISQDKLVILEVEVDGLNMRLDPEFYTPGNEVVQQVEEQGLQMYAKTNKIDPDRISVTHWKPGI